MRHVFAAMGMSGVGVRSRHRQPAGKPRRRQSKRAAAAAPAPSPESSYRMTTSRLPSARRTGSDRSTPSPT